MKCPHCNGEIDEQETDRRNGAAVGEDLFGQPRPATKAVRPDSRTGKRRTQLGADWIPNQAQRTYCEQQGKDPEAMAEAFKDYYRAKGTVWKDWNLVWMKACREWDQLRAKPECIETARERELSQWRARLASKIWMTALWGPRVGEPGCQVPKELLQT